MFQAFSIHLKHGILFLFSPNPLIKIGHFHYLALYSTFHHTCFLETFQDQIQYNDRMITNVVPARITGHGVDKPSLTGSKEMVTINVYFACFLK